MLQLVSYYRLSAEELVLLCEGNQDTVDEAKKTKKTPSVFYKFLLLNPTCFAERPSERSRTRAGEAGHLIHAFSSIQTRLGFTFVYV